jgi:hypothetical protein
VPCGGCATPHDMWCTAFEDLSALLHVHVNQISPPPSRSPHTPESHALAALIAPAIQRCGCARMCVQSCTSAHKSCVLRHTCALPPNACTHASNVPIQAPKRTQQTHTPKCAHLCAHPARCAQATITHPTTQESERALVLVDGTCLLCYLVATLRVPGLSATTETMATTKPSALSAELRSKGESAER